MDYLRTLLSSLRKADNDFSLIDNDDKIAVGLSGGKDSLTLLRLLSIYGKFSKKKFEVYPVFLDLGFEWNREKLEPLKEYCRSLGMKLHVEESTFVYDVLKANAKEGKHLPCSICSRMKKAGINRYAKEVGCNKVAFAHHSDDAIETLFMNMIHGGRIATFEPKMRLERAGITFIRPLIYCKEKDIIALSKEEKMPVTDTCCPANKKTDREETKKLIHSIVEKYPESEENFRLMLSNYKPFCLYWNRFEFEAMEDPSIAIRPIISASDMRLSSRLSKKPRENEENYLILKKHHVIGEFSLERKNKHHFILFAIKGQMEDTKIAFAELLRRETKIANPLKVEIEGNKKLAIAFGMVPSPDSQKRYFKKYLSYK